jgi:hypothetical protein
VQDILLLGKYEEMAPGESLTPKAAAGEKTPPLHFIGGDVTVFGSHQRRHWTGERARAGLAAIIFQAAKISADDGQEVGDHLRLTQQSVWDPRQLAQPLDEKPVFKRVQGRLGCSMWRAAC